jgi:hypothetical protein
LLTSNKNCSQQIKIHSHQIKIHSHQIKLAHIKLKFIHIKLKFTHIKLKFASTSWWTCEVVTCELWWNIETDRLIESHAWHRILCFAATVVLPSMKESFVGIDGKVNSKYYLNFYSASFTSNFNLFILTYCINWLWSTFSWLFTFPIFNSDI